MPKRKQKDLELEESLGEEWSSDYDIVEVSLGERPLFFAGACVLVVGAIFLGRIFYLNVIAGDFYGARAEANQSRIKLVAAPRGLIYDRRGEVLAENEAVWTAFLDTKEFFEQQGRQTEILQSIAKSLPVSVEEVLNRIQESAENDFTTPVVLKSRLTQPELVKLKALGLPAVFIEREFIRNYLSPVFSSVIGYVGRVDKNDLEREPGLGLLKFTGKSGIELFYDDVLRGKPGIFETRRDAKGEILNEGIKSEPEAGSSVRIALDGEFQEYFYSRLRSGLESLGRKIGVGLALDAKTGEVLALVNLPGFDGNILSGPGRNEEKRAILNSPYKPLFNRAVSGAYTPGSTIKPLVALAALKEGVVQNSRKIFSPGYIDIPNPYDPESFSRYRDWRYQGNVDVYSAIAQSSNVYFYIVGGGAPRGVDPQILAGGGYISGLGINRLNAWWQKFLLGTKTGIDLPGEAEGLLPTPRWKEEKTGRPWLLGDTYNVSIGQGDLLVTPIQLLSYIAAIANGGKIYEPIINLDRPHPNLRADLSEFLHEIREVQKGMELAVKSPLGTAHMLSDLGFRIAAKTGTAEVRSKTGENAFFAGYLPAEALTEAGAEENTPQLAILILVENSLEGSLNTVPIAKDVFNWYYWNRVVK